MAVALARATGAAAWAGAAARRTRPPAARVATARPSRPDVLDPAIVPPARPAGRPSPPGAASTMHPRRGYAQRSSCSVRGFVGLSNVGRDAAPLGHLAPVGASPLTDLLGARTPA